MVQEVLNVATILGVDLDDDGYDELFLPNRNDPIQSMFYLDCTGPDSYTEYYWGPDDERVLMADTTIRAGDSFNFIDLDGDGVKELVGLYRNYATGEGADTLRTTEVWVAKINPADPANLFSSENWAMVKVAHEMLGMEKREFGTGFFDVGDADADGLPDIYFGFGENAGSVIMDVEFVGTDWKNPAHYNHYKIIHAPGIIKPLSFRDFGFDQIDKGYPRFFFPSFHAKAIGISGKLKTGPNIKVISGFTFGFDVGNEVSAVPFIHKIHSSCPKHSGKILSGIKIDYR